MRTKYVYLWMKIN